MHYVRIDKILNIIIIGAESPRISYRHMRMRTSLTEGENSVETLHLLPEKSLRVNAITHRPCIPYVVGHLKRVKEAQSDKDASSIC